MGMFGRLRNRIVLIFSSLFIATSAPIALTGCRTYEGKATDKAVKIINSASKDVKHIDDEIQDAEALIGHIGKLKEDDQDQSEVIAQETLKALTDVKKVVDQGTALSTSDDSLEQQWDAYYDAYDAQVALQDLEKIVQNVQGWPKDQFGDYISAMEELQKATLKAIGKDTYTISVEEQQAEQEGQAEQEESTNENPNTTGNGTPTPPPDPEIDSPLEAAGKKVGGAAAEFRHGFTEGVENVEKKVDAVIEADDKARQQAKQEAANAEAEAEATAEENANNDWMNDLNDGRW